MNYDESQQIWLGLVLASLMFGVALELRLSHFLYVLRRPLPVFTGLLAQCLLLPWATLVATLFLDLKPGIELGLLLVACCPGGNLSNVISHRHLLLDSLGSLLLIVVLHNLCALLLGWGSARLSGLADFDRRALTIEVGMQNSGLALELIFTQFGAQPDMALIAALWGTWHIVSGLLLVALWRPNPPHLHTEKEEQPC